MKKAQWFSQEILKLLACISMLIDHTGAALFPQYPIMRVIGRLAFPIYCFLLVEGMDKTRSPGKYLLRLFIGILLAELPFDFLFRGGFDWHYQSVMVTLFLGGCMVLCMRRFPSLPARLLSLFVFWFLAESAMCDYGGWGILLIAIFALTDRHSVHAPWLILLNGAMPSGTYRLGAWSLPIQLFAALSLIPISLYSGKKLTRSPVVQWAFYLFYPVHLAILWAIRNFLL